MLLIAQPNFQLPYIYLLEGSIKLGKRLNPSPRMRKWAKENKTGMKAGEFTLKNFNSNLLSLIPFTNITDLCLAPLLNMMEGGKKESPMKGSYAEKLTKKKSVRKQILFQVGLNPRYCSHLNKHYIFPLKR